MSKKIKQVKSLRTSAKQKFAEYKSQALAYIQQLRFPKVAAGFNILTVEPTPTGKKPNALSAVELGAIVGTARQLGKEVRVRIEGSDDNTRLYFEYVDIPAPLPLNLQYPGF